jgi:hypothetical protein
VWSLGVGCDQLQIEWIDSVVPPGGAPGGKPTRPNPLQDRVRRDSQHLGGLACCEILLRHNALVFTDCDNCIFASKNHDVKKFPIGFIGFIEICGDSQAPHQA